MKKILRETLCYSVVSFFCTATTLAHNILPEDTTKVIDIEEVVVIASPKETSKLRQLPASVSLISQKDMQANGITSLKSASNIVPNFFMPDYGSRLTSMSITLVVSSGRVKANVFAMLKNSTTE